MENQNNENTQNAPNNNLVWAILSTIFCCLPFGIVSIVYAAKVDGLYRAGDYQGAKDAADKAKKFAIYGAICAIVVYVIYFIILLVAGINLD